MTQKGSPFNSCLICSVDGNKFLYISKKRRQGSTSPYSSEVKVFKKAIDLEFVFNSQALTSYFMHRLCKKLKRKYIRERKRIRTNQK